MTGLDVLVASADRHADRVAIEGEDGASVSYAGLFTAARRIGDRLVAGGIGRGDVVGLDVPRSAAWIAGALGAWFAGAAFLPLGPGLPPARRAVMLARAGARTVLGTGELAVPGAPERAGIRSVPSRGLDDLAYVVFTSGSTGEPRGVMVPHRGLPALFAAQVAAFALEPGSRALWLHSPLFDASISDVGTALAAGATLVLAGDQPVRGPDDLVRLLEHRRISHVDLPTALLGWLELVRAPAGLRTVVLGGAPCPPEAVCRLAERVRVVVVYGPTEATVCSSLAVVDPATWREPGIGEPLPGVRYRVEGDELWIGGDGLALGYAGDAAATAARFVVDGGERWYRTGDRVEATPHGLVFRGRADRQVKLAGRRIELDEIEAVLGAVAGVVEAAVCVRALDPSRAGGAAPVRLVGFVAPAGVDVAAIRAAALARLPSWMVPTVIVPVAALPRTATGKVDPAALTTWPIAADAGGGVPASAVARELAPLWCAALGVPAVDGADRFAASGGDSLSMLGLAASAEARGLPLPTALLDDDPTFAELAARVAAAAGAPGDVTTVAAIEAQALDALAARLPSWKRPPRRSHGGVVLVTGATGFLGTRLVAAWARRDARPILCLVRARDAAAARRRLEGALRDAGIDGLATRIEVICGDVAAPGLGLDEPTWHRLANEAGSVVHAAGLVHLSLGWDAFAPVHVGGTIEIARLVATGAAKAWHHVSTLSVFASTDRALGSHREADRPDAAAVPHGGYAATKIAAEAVARAFAGVAAPLTILRPGLLTGDTRTGLAAPGEQLGLVVRGLARLGAVPAGAGALAFDVTPVDHAADAIAALALRAEAEGADAVHHIASPRAARLDELAAALRAEGVPLDEIPTPDWAERALAHFADPAVAMAYLALARIHAPDRARLRRFDLFLATGADFAAEGTAEALAVLDVRIPDVGITLLRTLVRGALR